MNTNREDKNQFEEQCLFSLPMTINKFMEFQPIEENNFTKTWKYLKSNKIKSKKNRLNPAIIQSNDDLLHIFPFIISLKENHKVAKYGGIFTLNDIFSLLKISVTKNNEISFKLTCKQNQPLQKEFIIETLLFLFTKNC